MKKLINGTIGLILIVGFTGCGSTWMAINKVKIDNNKLEHALNECKFEEKRKLANRYLAGTHGDNQLVNERMKKLHKETYSGALKCMETQGFVKK